MIVVICCLFCVDCSALPVVCCLLSVGCCSRCVCWYVFFVVCKVLFALNELFGEKTRKNNKKTLPVFDVKCVLIDGCSLLYGAWLSLVAVGCLLDVAR